METIKKWLEDATLPQDQRRPLVTLCYAQSLDGSLAVERGHRTAISGEETMRLTHLIRAQHDAILVGIGTVLSDNPQLTVRLSPGKSPRAVVLDSHLRIPLECNLLRRTDHRMILFAGQGVEADKRAALEKKGVIVLENVTPPGQPINLRDALGILWGYGVRKLMVEGGAEIITSFLKERLVDRAVITIAPFWLGGLASIGQPLVQTPGVSSTTALPSIREPAVEILGRDMIVYGWVGEVKL